MNYLRRFLLIVFHSILYIFIGAFFLVGLIRTGILIHSRPKTFLPEDVPEAPVALVLGAGLNRDGSPGVVLRDRVETAAELYFSGKVEKL